MTNYVLLNNKTHKDIKINTNKSVKLGNNISYTLTFPTEYIHIQRDYPILFSKNPDTGAFQSVVLFGLRQNENLFLKRGTWHASYIPAVIEKEPFLIGHEEQNVNGEIINNPVVCIDMDNARVSYDEGEAIFTTTGENTPYLNQISHHLMLINTGIETSKKMFDAFIAHDLLETITLNIELNNGEKICIDGNYTINQNKLSKLSATALEELNSQGFLQMAYMVVASINNIQKLVDMQNSRL
ncbi:SapC family protein [Thalassotalea agariperforans]